jgi:hypothetical protein
MTRPLGRKERRALARVQAKQRQRASSPDRSEVPALGVAATPGGKRYVFNDALSRQLAAVHEAGHAIVSVVTGHPLHATEISADGSGWTPNQPGHPVVLLDFKKPEDRAYARRMAVLCCAGESAEGSYVASLLQQRGLPPANAPDLISDAAELDHDHAVQLVALLQRHEMDGSQSPALREDQADQHDISFARVAPVFHALQQEADAIIEAYWPAVVAVAGALVRQSRLTGDEVRAIVRSHPPASHPHQSSAS